MRYWVLLVVTVALPRVGSAATHYVRAGATGDGSGSDWTNACTGFSGSCAASSLTRGDTYYVADGSYGSVTFNTAASGTQVITIKKATLADHGTLAGWQDSFGEGQATFSGPVQFSTSYHVFDGNQTSGYGFVIDIPPGPLFGLRLPSVTPQQTAITVRSVSISGVNADSGARCITLTTASNLFFSNIEGKLTENDAISMVGVTDSIFEHLYFHSRRFGAGVHGDAFELWGGGNNTIRYSRVAWNGQQVFWGGGVTHGRWDIYGNTFYGGATAGKGLHAHSTDPVIGPLFVYNNTFHDLTSSLTLKANTTGDIRNNIFHSTSSPIFGSASHDFNWFETGLSSSGEASAQAGTDPFVNAAGANFRLAIATNNGEALAISYDTDADAKIRGADGVWDRGAFEFVEDGGVAPGPPRNLKVLP